MINFIIDIDISCIFIFFEVNLCSDFFMIFDIVFDKYFNILICYVWFDKIM